MCPGCPGQLGDRQAGARRWPRDCHNQGNLLAPKPCVPNGYTYAHVYPTGVVFTRLCDTARVEAGLTCVTTSVPDTGFVRHPRSLAGTSLPAIIRPPTAGPLQSPQRLNVSELGQWDGSVGIRLAQRTCQENAASRQKSTDHETHADTLQPRYLDTGRRVWHPQLPSGSSAPDSTLLGPDSRPPLLVLRGAAAVPRVTLHRCGVVPPRVR